MVFNHTLEKLIEKNQWQEAKDLCNNWLLQTPNSEEAHYSMGLVCAKLGLLSDAICHFEKTLSVNPTRIECFINLSNLFNRMGHLEKAQQYLNQALRLNPHYAEGYNNLGHLLYKQGLWQEARPYFEKALRLNPNYWEAHYNLAHTFTNMNRVQSAILHYREVIRLVPNHASAHSNIGLLYFEDKNYIDAETHLHKATTLAHDNKIAWYYLGHAELALGHSQEAIFAFEHALHAESPYLGEIHHNLGVLYLRNQEKEKALQHFEQALVYQSDNDTAKHMIVSLQGIQASTQAPNQYVTDLFNQYADYYNEHVKHNLKYAAPGLLRNAVSRCLGAQIKTGHILDLGCGTGLCGVYFRDLALELVGVDISHNMVEKAKRLDAYDSLVVSDILEYLNNYKKAVEFYPFNLIIAGDVLVYFGNLEPLFTNVVKVLVKGGLFAFTIENIIPDLHQENKPMDYILNPTGRYAHSWTYIDQLAKENNLSIELDEPIALREQEGNTVQGQLFVCRLNH